MARNRFVKPDTVRLSISEGDWLEVIGPHQSVDHLAASLGTISYEVLTSLSHRAERIIGI